VLDVLFTIIGWKINLNNQRDAHHTYILAKAGKAYSIRNFIKFEGTLRCLKYNGERFSLRVLVVLRRTEESYFWGM
jgi:hypothetical protein